MKISNYKKDLLLKCNPPKCPIQYGNTFLACHWHPQDSSWKTPMPMPIWTPADKQVHRPTAICHQDSLWDDMHFSQPLSLAFLFLTCVGMTFTHSRMLPKHIARTPGVLLRYSGFYGKWGTCFKTVGMFNIPVSGKAHSGQTKHSVENKVNKNH